jgi:hypothetical protein
MVAEIAERSNQMLARCYHRLGFAQRALLREDDFGMIDKLLEAM